MKKILLSPWLALVTLSLILSVRYFDPDFSQVVRLKYFDQLISSQPHKDIPVSVVNIDEAALDKYGQFRSLVMSMPKSSETCTNVMLV